MNLIGIAIGGTKCCVVLGREDKDGMTVLGRESFPTCQGGGPYGTFERLARLGDELLRQHGIDRPDAVGIACGSPLDPIKGIIQSPPNLLGWDDIPAAALMQEHFGAPAFLENDANAGALAEWRYGAARGYRHIAFITFGTGCGAGLILNGKLYSGACGMAGECGHIRLAPFGPVGYGKQGSVEGFCSGGGIRQLAQQMVLEQLQQGKKPMLCPSADKLDELTAKSVAEAAYNGNPLAQEIYRCVGQKLGETLSVIIDFINPEIIVIGSIFARAESLIRPAMEEVIQRETLPVSRRACSIVPAELRDNVDEYEALAIASYALAQQAEA